MLTLEDKFLIVQICRLYQWDAAPNEAAFTQAFRELYGNSLPHYRRDLASLDALLLQPKAYPTWIAPFLSLFYQELDGAGLEEE